MFKINYNPVSKRWNERVCALSQEKQDLISAPSTQRNLLVIKKSNESIKGGDVFVVSPKEGVYFFGKVLEAYVRHIKHSGWLVDCHVICVFKCKSKNKDIKEFKPNYDSLLVNPSIVTSDYWEKGWIETIGHTPLAEEEKNLDYGFYSKDLVGTEGAFYKANGEVLDHMPKIYTSNGVMTFRALYEDIRVELIIDHSLLK